MVAESHVIEAAYRALGPRLLAYFAHIGVANCHDRDDLLAEVAASAFSALAERRGPQPETVDAWLLTIARRTALRYQRDKRRAPLELDGTLDDGLWSLLATEHAADALRDAELYAEVKLRLQHANLTPEARALLTAHLAGSPHRAIAAEAGCSPATVGRRLRAIITQLRCVNVDPFLSAEVDHYAWRVANSVSIYHPPQRTGAALANMTPAQRRRNILEASSEG